MESQTHQARAYQLEMLYESLKENVIVAMDTGTGKTDIAILRIQKEFEKPESANKIAWFLCPTVGLARQQHRAVSAQIQGLSVKLIVGDDGVDHWSTQTIWDAILKNQNVVVSTYQVLLDAIQHGFLTLGRLCLLVIDEAHNCAREGPLNKLMQNFFHPWHQAKRPVPSILALTASPVRGSNLKELDTLEINLAATCKSPVATFEELLKYTQTPELEKIIFTPADQMPNSTSVEWKLRMQYDNLDMLQDPWVLHLLEEGYSLSNATFYAAVDRRQTFVADQLRSLMSSIHELRIELGEWASQIYLYLWHLELQRRLSMVDVTSISAKEMQFLDDLLVGLQIPSTPVPLVPAWSEISDKASRLLKRLVLELHGSSVGIVFVKTRATVRLLEFLLNASPCLKGIVKTDTFVGMSSISARNSTIKETLFTSADARNLGLKMVLRPSDQMNTLDGLRSGSTNVLICTDACEEGIDISACNFVICYDEPRSLKSFIQRRGRARAVASKFVIMQANDRIPRKDWMILERDMKRMYLDKLREVQERERLESYQEQIRELYVESTQAKITSQEAVSHLEHFCNVLPARKFATTRPIYTFENTDHDLYVCKITLPSSLDISLRYFAGSREWRSERLAKRDVAFEAYLALYRAGLVNDHLLPAPAEDVDYESFTDDIPNFDGFVDIQSQTDPYQSLAQTWQSAKTIFLYEVILTEANESSLGEHSKTNFENMLIGLPTKLSNIDALTLYWDQCSKYSLTFAIHSQVSTETMIKDANAATDALLRTVFRSRMSEDYQNSYPILYVPKDQVHRLSEWTFDTTRIHKAQSLVDQAPNVEDYPNFVIRRQGSRSKPWQLLNFGMHMVKRDSHSEIQEAHLCCEGRKLSSRTDYLHPAASKILDMGKQICMPVDEVEVQEMPLPCVLSALLLPCIMHHLGRTFLIEQFRSCYFNSLRAPGCGVSDLSNSTLLEALTTSSAQEVTNYQKLEFLGDSVLGFAAAFTISSTRLKWHAGYLSRGKDRIVNNKHLTSAAIRLQLGKYIMAQTFTGARWTPPKIADLIEAAGLRVSRRKLSSKILADIIEALIGGIFREEIKNRENFDCIISPAVLEMLQLLLPSVQWVGDSEHISRLQANIDTTLNLPPHLTQVENLLQYSFTKPALLVESLTHPSYPSISSTTSYDRLEFLGDSLLEVLVTQYISKHELSVGRMHLLRTAVVNNYFLAFLVMDRQVLVQQNEVVRLDEPPAQSRSTPTYSTTPIKKSFALHNFLLHGPSRAFSEAHAKTVDRFTQLGPSIRKAFDNGGRYPWSSLAKFAPEKMFSDIFESVLAAIYIDSKSVATCHAVLEAFGVWKFLERAVRERVHITQPRQEIGVLASRAQVKISYIIDDTYMGNAFKCTLSLNEKPVGYGEARQRATAKTLAAADALRWIEEAQQECCHNEHDHDSEASTNVNVQHQDWLYTILEARTFRQSEAENMYRGNGSELDAHIEYRAIDWGDVESSDSDEEDQGVRL